jgi:hypothetical protein
MTQKQSRRHFVKTVAITAGVGPAILNAADKAGTKPIVIGDGEHRYECTHGWGALPQGHEYGWTSNGIAIDSQRHVYVTHHGKPGSIFEFDETGKFVRAFGDQHIVKNAGAGHGIDIRKEGNEEFIYLSPDHTSLAFTKMTLKGEVVWTKGKAELSGDSGVKLSRYRPTNCSFRPDGGYYLGDGYGSSYVFQYDKDDKFVKAIRGPGGENKNFSTPHGQWLDDRDGTPKLVVCDRSNKRLCWFDMDGNFLKAVGGFPKPADIDVQGDWLIVADVGASITVLDKADKIVAKLGHEAEWENTVMNRKNNIRGKRDQWRDGLFIHPHDACFDPDGNIYVAEYVSTGRVTKLRKLG